MVSIVIQAGGKSSRMGRDKSFIPLCGMPMIQFVMQKVSGLGDDLIITTNEPAKYIGFNARIVSDEYPNVGALAGLHAGIKAANHDLVIVVANDMPFVNLDLFDYMQTIMHPGVDVVVPCTTKGYEPFHAIYRKSTCLPAIEKAIHAQQRRIISWFGVVNVLKIQNDLLDKFDPVGLAFYNVNTPHDVLFAEQQVSLPD